MDLLEKSIDLYLGIKAAKIQTDPMYLQMRDFIFNHFAHDGTRALAAADEIPIIFTYKQNPGGNRPVMRAFQHPLNVNKNRQRETEPELQINGGDGESAYSQLKAEYDRIGQEILTLKPDDPHKAYLLKGAVWVKTQMNALSSNAPKTAGDYVEGTSRSTTKQSNILTQRAGEDQARREALKDVGKQSPQPSDKKADVAGKSEKGEIGKVGDVAKVADIVPIDVEKVRDMRGKAISQAYSAESLKSYLSTNNVVMTGKESHTQLANLVLHHIKG